MRLPQSTLGRVLLYGLILIAVVAIAYSFLGRSEDESRQNIPLSDVITLARNGDVASIEVRRNKLTVTTKDGEEFDSRKEGETSLIDVLTNAGVQVGGPDGVEITVKQDKGGWAGVIISFLPLILFGGIIVFFMIRMNRRRSE